MNTMRILVVLGLVLSFGAVVLASEPISLTYIVGSGYIVRQGDLAVAIDALNFYTVPSDTRALMQSAQPPFDVDLILVTHSDIDHFDVRAVGDNMTANPAAILIAPANAVHAVQMWAPQINPARCIVVGPSLGASVRQDFPGVSIEAFSLPHPPAGAPENVGYRLTFDGLVLTHPGDLDTTRAATDLVQNGWDRVPADVAIVLYTWFSREERALLPLMPATRYVPTHGSWDRLPAAYDSTRDAGVDVICLVEPFQEVWLNETPSP
jgi:L-ascorbate metabolism protein UlaG (beta-lactamase superfamily)